MEACLSFCASGGGGGVKGWGVEGVVANSDPQSGGGAQSSNRDCDGCPFDWRNIQYLAKPSAAGVPVKTK